MSVTLEQGVDIQDAVQIMKAVGEEVHPDTCYSGGVRYAAQIFRPRQRVLQQRDCDNIVSLEQATEI